MKNFKGGLITVENQSINFIEASINDLVLSNLQIKGKYKINKLGYFNKQLSVDASKLKEIIRVFMCL